MLSRLTSTANPESGMSATSYYYTTTISGSTPCSGEPSEVCLRVAPQANQASSSVTTTTTYSYDPLNRLTAVSYNDPTPTTPTMKYGYDAVALTGCTTTPPTLSITNGLGRRTSMCDGSGGTSWSYDGVGDILTEKRTLNSVTNTTQYTYNLDATLASVVYQRAKREDHQLPARRCTEAFFSYRHGEQYQLCYRCALFPSRAASFSNEWG